jgi:hypothetical protein
MNLTSESPVPQVASPPSKNPRRAYLVYSFRCVSARCDAVRVFVHAKRPLKGPWHGCPVCARNMLPQLGD